MKLNVILGENQGKGRKVYQEQRGRITRKQSKQSKEATKREANVEPHNEAIFNPFLGVLGHIRAVDVGTVVVDSGPRLALQVPGADNLLIILTLLFAPCLM